MKPRSKPTCEPLATALAALLAIPLLAAPRPLAWRADFPSARVENFPVRHGTDVDFRPTWYVNGSPADTNGWTYSLSVQTNGAPAGEWATIPGTVFSHTNDCGAEAYNVLVRAVDRDGTVDYSAAARLRMLPSPGFTPGELPPADTFQESDPVFSDWLSTFEIPETSLEPATNYTAQSLAAFAATGTVKKARSATSAGSADRATEADVATFAYNLYASDWTSWTVPSLLRASTNAAEAVVGHHASDMSNPHNVTAEQIGAAPESIVQAVTNLQVESTLVYRLYSGSNVVAEVTNYNSQVHAPALRIMQLNESNEYVSVWAETNGLARTLRDATDYADEAISSRAAPRAWSATTSGLGADAPPNTTWVSTPRTVIAGGLEYAKIVDTYGEVWVLSSNGMAAEFNPDTNAYFRITADDGTDIFSIEKTDAQVVGADADGITVGESSVVIPVGVVSAEHPTMFWRQVLESGSWADESSPPTGATVAWTGGAGAWVCTVTWSGTRPSSMFFKFTYLQEGGVVIRNNASTDISAGIYVNGVKFIPSVSGNNLIWTMQQ